ncbi:hypothetical protein PVA17_24055 [Lysinibacillus sp. CNPSo 3705]|uniref:hypothetical protein n=1 Tax=Lysinibacillus sp. CNPSo 3705 TaxID=3028148 RepID=UPI0023632B70|nr:hypothetical protein [Lysinibacillus sp. CNPSo 3705]MDD1505795.1 hypothetical protein [Lysinibacillus sp. CNPSo 3705]
MNDMQNGVGTQNDLNAYLYLKEEVEAIKRTFESPAYVRSKPLDDLGFKILNELNNHEPDSGIRFYSKSKDSTLNKYPNVIISDIQKHLAISIDVIIDGIKVLFIKRYIDFNLPRTVKVNEILQLSIETRPDEQLLKYGLVFEHNLQGVEHIRLTERGFLAMMDYSVKEMQLLKKELIEFNVQNREQLDELKRLDSERLGAIGEIDEKIKGTESIKKFNENIFTIFSIMLAIFAVIGINVASIPKIENNFILNVIVVNFSVCFSLIVLFYLMNTLLYREKNKALSILLITFSIAFAIAFIAIGLKEIIRY